MHNDGGGGKVSHVLKSDVDESNMCWVGWVSFYFCNKRQCCNLFTWERENKTTFVIAVVVWMLLVLSVKMMSNQSSSSSTIMLC